MDALVAIASYWEIHRRPPLLREIGQKLGVTVGRAGQLASRLADRGHVSSEAGRPRTLTLTESGRRWVESYS